MKNDFHHEVSFCVKVDSTLVSGVGVFGSNNCPFSPHSPKLNRITEHDVSGLPLTNDRRRSQYDITQILNSCLQLIHNGASFIFIYI
jgi:hypothetical protein